MAHTEHKSLLEFPCSVVAAVVKQIDDVDEVDDDDDVDEHEDDADNSAPTGADSFS